jgi:hypothetical protein
MPNLTVLGVEAILWRATRFFLVNTPADGQFYMKDLLN